MTGNCFHEISAINQSLELDSTTSLMLVPVQSRE